jgi:hypothetical protein
MKIKSTTLEVASVVILTKAFDLNSVSLDAFKDNATLPSLVRLPDRILIGENALNGIKIIIEPHRVEINSGTGAPVANGSFGEIVADVLSRLQPADISIRAIGTNYFVRFLSDDGDNAGTFITQKFLNSPKAIEGIVGGPIISSSVRIMYGEKTDYKDIRIYPIELTGAYFGCQFHSHRDISGPINSLSEDLKTRFRPELDFFIEKLGAL